MIPAALSDMGIQFTEQSGQIITGCPYCGKGSHLYIDTGKRVFYCQRCGEKGTWRALSERLGVNSTATIQPAARKEYKHPTDEYVQACHKKILGPSGVKAMEYLNSRKITNAVIQQFRLGLEEKDGKQWLVIPYYANGKPVNVKYRSIPPAPKEFRRWKDGESALYNGDCLKPLKDGDEILVVEGEIDCLTLVSCGITSVVSTSIGASGIKPEWIEALERFKNPVIVYDSDEPGQKGAKELARRLDYDRCRNVVLPVKDCNDFFVSGRAPEEFKRLVSQSSCFPVDNILTMEQVFKNLIATYDESKKSTALKPQWHSVSRIQGPYENGDLIVLSAKPKTGKTTYAINEGIHHAKAGAPTLIFCLEMRPERIMKKCFQILGNYSEDSLNPYLMTRLYGELAEMPLYCGYVYRKCTLDIVLDTIRRGMRRYGFKLIIFDNLHFLARSMTHQVQEVGLISKSFKLLAEELGVPIILIAQPKRVNEDRVIGIDDLKDSSSIGADADTVVILYRKKKAGEAGETEASFEPETLVRVDASRFHAGGETMLYFNGETGRFTELERRTQ